MPITTTIPPALIDMFVGFLVPPLLTAAGGDQQAARALALRLLAQCRPTTARELSLATEALAFRLKSLAMLATAAEPDQTPDGMADALKCARDLSHVGYQAQQRLDGLQRERRADIRRQEVVNKGGASHQARPPVAGTARLPLARARRRQAAAAT